MRLVKIILTMCMVLLLTACFHQIETVAEETEGGELAVPEASDLPEVVEVSFGTVEVSKLTEGGPKQTWEYIKPISLSTIEDKSVTLHVYNETDPDRQYGLSTVSLLEYDGKMYELNDCTSASFLADNPEEDGSLYIMQHLFAAQGKQQILHSSIELVANGPGRMLYIMYDITEDKLLTFEDWGIPYLVDLEQAGEFFLVVQFPGLHMHSPDVNIYRWINGQFEKSQSLKESLGMDNQQNYLQFDECSVMFIAYVLLDEESQDFAEIHYWYENGKLIRIN